MQGHGHGQGQGTKDKGKGRRGKGVGGKGRGASDKGQKGQGTRVNFFAVPPPTHTLQHSTRVEWLEWWKGWLLRSGAFPLRDAWGV